MAACCTPSVDMAISQTWQPKVTSTIPYNFSSPFCWIEICWIHPERALSELAFGKSGFVLSVCWEDVPGVWRQPKGLFQHKGDYAKTAKSVEKGFIENHVLRHILAEPIFLKSQVQGSCVRWLASQPAWDNQGILVCQSRKFWLTTILHSVSLAQVVPSCHRCTSKDHPSYLFKTLKQRLQMNPRISLSDNFCLIGSIQRLSKAWKRH